MSSTRIYSCLSHASCKITKRGEQVLKWGGIGLMLGSVSGATLGGISVGCEDYTLKSDGETDFKNKHRGEDGYKQICNSYKNKWGDTVVQCDDNKALRDAAEKYGYQYAQDEIAKVGPWIALWCTVGGAALGLLTGLSYGWCKALPSGSDDDQDEQHYNRMNP